MQAAHVQTKARAFAGMTDKVSSGLEANEVLLQCANKAQHTLTRHKSLLEAVNARQLQRQRSAKQQYKDTVTNKKLRDTATAQLQEIKQLHAEKMRWAERSFPAFGTH